MEYVQIKNNNAFSINLLDWQLHDFGERHVFTFPNIVMTPGRTCRIYTNYLDGQCNLTFGLSRGVWNNDGDRATLKNYLGNIVHTYEYGIPSSIIEEE